MESMWSQTLVIHMIRTPKIPFIQSRASAPLTLLTFAAIGLLTVIPFTGFGASIGLAALPGVYFLYLGYHYSSLHGSSNSYEESIC